MSEKNMDPHQRDKFIAAWDAGTAMSQMCHDFNITKKSLRNRVRYYKLTPRPVRRTGGKSCPWPDRDFELVAHWVAGVSVAKIGVAMRLTTNSVVGRVHRLVTMGVLTSRVSPLPADYAKARAEGGTPPPKPKPTPAMQREPKSPALPPGHPDTWGLISQGQPWPGFGDDRMTRPAERRAA